MAKNNNLTPAQIEELRTVLIALQFRAFHTQISNTVFSSPSETRRIYNNYLRRKLCYVRVPGYSAPFALYFSKLEQNIDAIPPKEQQNHQQPDLEQQAVAIVDEVLQNQAVVTEIAQIHQKKAGRGKARKPPVSRSQVTFLMNDSDIERFNAIATTQDISFSQVCRLAVKNYLKQL